MKIAVIVFLICMSLYAAVQSVHGIINVLVWIPRKKCVADEDAEADARDETPVQQPKYDVNAYRERIRKMKETMDKDGLFDWVDAPPQDDVTGIEIIGDDL